MPPSIPLASWFPLRSYQGLATLEFHYPKLDVYFNGGEDYSGRRYQTDTLGTGKVVGYGSPTYADGGCYTETLPSSSSPGGYNFGGLGSCSGQTQSAIEGTFGFWIQTLQRAQGQTSVRAAVFLHKPKRVDGCRLYAGHRRCSTRNR